MSILKVCCLRPCFVVVHIYTFFYIFFKCSTKLNEGDIVGQRVPYHNHLLDGNDVMHHGDMPCILVWDCQSSMVKRWPIYCNQVNLYIFLRIWTFWLLQFYHRILRYTLAIPKFYGRCVNLSDYIIFMLLNMIEIKKTMLNNESIPTLL